VLKHVRTLIQWQPLLAWFIGAAPALTLDGQKHNRSGSGDRAPRLEAGRPALRAGVPPRPRPNTQRDPIAQGAIASSSVSRPAYNRSHNRGNRSVPPASRGRAREIATRSRTSPWTNPPNRRLDTTLRPEFLHQGREPTRGSGATTGLLPSSPVRLALKRHPVAQGGPPTELFPSKKRLTWSYICSIYLNTRFFFGLSSTACALARTVWRRLWGRRSISQHLGDVHRQRLL